MKALRVWATLHSIKALLTHIFSFFSFLLPKLPFSPFLPLALCFFIQPPWLYSSSVPQGPMERPRRMFAAICNPFLLDNNLYTKNGSRTPGKCSFWFLPSGLTPPSRARPLSNRGHAQILPVFPENAWQLVYMCGKHEKYVTACKILQLEAFTYLKPPKTKEGC